MLENLIGVLDGVEIAIGFCFVVECVFLLIFKFNGMSSSSSLLVSFVFFGIFNLELKTRLSKIWCMKILIYVYELK